MAQVFLLNKTATATEQTNDHAYYGIKLLINDAVAGGGNLLVGFDNSVDDGNANYLMLKPGESVEDWNAVTGGKLYYKSSTGSVPFRFYSGNR